uniref:Zinc finger SWIM-type containing 7 n=2 Tax=Salvator merianae TaxID=96440 RepID=A0A8D0BS73_SALMN
MCVCCPNEMVSNREFGSCFLSFPPYFSSGLVPFRSSLLPASCCPFSQEWRSAKTAKAQIVTLGMDRRDKEESPFRNTRRPAHLPVFLCLSASPPWLQSANPSAEASVAMTQRLGLKFVFRSSAVPALDLVDRQSVTRITSPSGRTVFQVVGSSGKRYTCYSSCHFCNCPAFAFSVLRKGNSLVCKHLLAVYLSQAVGSCQELTVPDKQLTRLLLPEEEKSAAENEVRGASLLRGDSARRFGALSGR